ncbi:MAG TPA: tripartite tricarboxylate transporter substrate binding protein [Burkholderiales bacterium]|nr:tripartite tricarboxylate transporter substrate binding protein [Burkholderiales bacterium]
MKPIVFLAAVVAVLISIAAAHAQDAYPSRPIRLLMPFGAGGTVDIMTRPLAAKLHEQLKRPVIVDNRPSAGGVLAAELTANATPDGYTLFLASSSALFVAPAYYKKVNYDPIKDFAPISLIAQQPLLIVANTSLPFRDVKGLIAYAKERPGKLNYGTVGRGSTNHFTAELLSHAAGIKMVLVPYKSGAQGVAAAIGGEVQLVFTQPNTGLPHVKAGRVNAIATTGVKRHPLYPDVGTLVEAGYKDLAITGYYTVVGPAKMPRAIVQRLNSEIRRAMESPDVGDVLRNQGTEPVTSTPEELSALIKQETARWQRAAKLTGIKEQ